MQFSSKIISTAAVIVLTAFSQVSLAQTTPSHALDKNPLSYAVAWKQTAAEYRALYYQGFNIAKIHVDEALAKHKSGDRPLAIITDIDDTLLLPLPYWNMLLEKDIGFFDDAIWDKWIPSNKMVASPGSLAFLRYCKEKGIEIFYVSSRDQGEKTFEYALGNLKRLGFPVQDESHVTILRDTSNKQKRQDEIMIDHDVIVFLGDNLNDFSRKYYIKSDVGGRIAKMEEDRDFYGKKYILFPNPTDGHWLAAIFGQSEPEPTPESHQLLRKAAEGKVK